MTTNKPIYQQKTFWVAVIAIITAMSGYLTGEMSLIQALSAAVASGLIATLRDALKGAPPQPSQSASADDQALLDAVRMGNRPPETPTV